MTGWVRAAARPTPRKVFGYDQGLDERWRVRKVTSNGACFGLSIFWVIQKANGSDYLTWLGPPKAASPQGNDPPGMGKNMDDAVRVMQQQDKLLALPQGRRELTMKWACDRIAALDGGGGSTKLEVSGALALLQGAGTGQIAAAIVALDGYRLIVFEQKDGPHKICHAVAAHVDGATVTYFDPNVGEYAFAEAQTFLTWFVNDHMRGKYGLDALDEVSIAGFRMPAPAP